MSSDSIKKLKHKKRKINMSKNIEEVEVTLDQDSVAHVKLKRGDFILHDWGIPAGETELGISYRDGTQFWGLIDLIHARRDNKPKRNKEITWNVSLKFTKNHVNKEMWNKVLTINNPTRKMQYISILGYAIKGPIQK